MKKLSLAEEMFLAGAAPAPVAPAKAAPFNPAAHPRAGAGAPAGGRFVSAQKSAPAPPVVKPKTPQEAGDRIFGYLQQHGFSFPNKPFVVLVPHGTMTGSAGTAVPSGESIAGQALVGGQINIDQWYGGKMFDEASIALILHEILHQTVTGGYPENPTYNQQRATEQAVDTMMEDLLPSVLTKLGYGTSTIGTVMTAPGYPNLVTRERKASAQATGKVWTSKEARAWRAQQFLKNSADRALLSEEESAMSELSLAEEMFGLDLAMVKGPLQKGEVKVKGHWRRITHPGTGAVMRIFVKEGTRHQMLRHWRPLEENDDPKVGPIKHEASRIDKSRKAWSAKMYKGKEDVLTAGNIDEFYVARNVKIDRSVSVEAEQMYVAQQTLDEFKIKVPDNVTTWPQMKKFLATLWKVDSKVKVPKNLAPGGKDRTNFRARINPKTIEKEGPLLVQAHNAYADALEKLSAVGGKAIVEYDVWVHKDPPEGILPPVDGVRDPKNEAHWVECPKGKYPGKKCIEIDYGERSLFWASFYGDARHEIAQIADNYDLDPGLVADIMAIMSVGNRWTGPGQTTNTTGNQAVAKRTIEFLRDHGIDFTPEDVKSKGSQKKGEQFKVTAEQVQKAIAAYGREGVGGEDFRAAGKTGLGSSDERKTTNFALALFGDLDAFVADRHMANLAFTEGYARGAVGPPVHYDAMEHAARRIAAEAGMQVGTLQAVLWGYQREVGGVDEAAVKLKENRARASEIKGAIPEITAQLPMQLNKQGEMKRPSNVSATTVSRALREAQLRRIDEDVLKSKKFKNIRLAEPVKAKEAIRQMKLVIPEEHPFWQLPEIPDDDLTTDWGWVPEKREWVKLPETPTGPKPGLTRRDIQVLGLAAIEDGTFAQQVLGRYFAPDADILDMRNAMMDLFKGIGIANKVEQKGLSLAERMFGMP